MAVVYMGSFGSMSEFDKSKETWKSYIERLEFFFEANDVTENTRKRAVLLTICGPEMYKLITNLLMPSTPKETSYENIVKAVEKHLQPTVSVALQRYKFNQTVRRPNESISAYINYLRQLAKDCNFGNSLEDMLRDRLVCGVNNEHIQKRLFAQPDLTFRKATDIALAEEAAEKQASDVRGSQTGTVNAVGRKPDGRESLQCYRCLGISHTPSKCKFKDAICHYCGVKGHVQKACRNRNRDVSQKPSHFHPKSQNGHDLEPRFQKSGSYASANAFLA